MEFFYDVHGITWEGAFICALISSGVVVLLWVLFLKGISAGVKYLRKRKLAKEVKTLLNKPENEKLLRYIAGK